MARRKIKSKRVKKKIVRKPAGPEKISASDLELLTGLTDRRHRQIAEEGYFPKPEHSRYLRDETIAGLFRFYRERSERDTLTKERVLLTQAKRITQESLNAERSGELESKEAIARRLFGLGEEIKSTLNFNLLDRLPALNAGLDAPAQRINNRAILLEVLARWREFSKKWTAEGEEKKP